VDRHSNHKENHHKTLEKLNVVSFRYPVLTGLGIARTVACWLKEGIFKASSRRIDQAGRRDVYRRRRFSGPKVAFCQRDYPTEDSGEDVEQG